MKLEKLEKNIKKYFLSGDKDSALKTIEKAKKIVKMIFKFAPE